MPTDLQSATELYPGLHQYIPILLNLRTMSSQPSTFDTFATKTEFLIH
jgi:hypothetical protein